MEKDEKITKFDKSKEIIDSKIIDEVENLRMLCNRHQIPMFISLCVKNNEKETVYKNEMVSSTLAGVELKDDLLVKFVDVLNGFDTVPSGFKPNEFDDEDFE